MNRWPNLGREELKLLDRLLDQCFAIYAEWAANGINTEHGSMLLTGLFQILGDVDPERRTLTFFRATRGKEK